MDYRRNRTTSQPNIRVSNAAGVPTIEILDDIGPDWLGMISAETISRALAQCGKAKEIVVLIQSFGGDVFEGIAIYNLLARHPAKITMRIVGIAASAASLICMAGDTIEIADNGLLMVHEAWTGVAGNRHDLRKAAAVLDKVNDSLISIYHNRTGIGVSRLADMLLAETWMSAKESVSLGFADEITSAGMQLPVANSEQAGRFKNAPPSLVGDAPKKRDWFDVMKLVEQSNQELGIDAPAPRDLDALLAEIEKVNHELGLAV